MDDDIKTYLLYLQLKAIEHLAAAKARTSLEPAELGHVLVDIVMGQAHMRAAEILESGKGVNVAVALQDLSDAIMESRGTGPVIVAMVEALAAKALTQPN